MPEAKYGLPENVLFCKRCVISNQRPSSTAEFSHTKNTIHKTINFNADGVCDACLMAEKKKGIDWAQREKELLTLLSQHRSYGSSYDCIVPGSGGKDSVFAAHILKHKYGMHPLLVTWSPALFTDWGFRNLQRWQSIAPHFLVTPNREVNRLLTRLSLENLFHIFHCFTIGQKAMAPKMAARFGIPLVFFGEGEYEYGNSISESESSQRSSIYHTSSDVHLGGISVRDLRRDYGLVDSDLEPYLPASAEVLRNVQVHYLGYYLKWHPQSAYYYAVEHGQFEAAPHRTPGTYSKYNSIDDKLDDLHYWTTYIKFGIGRATYDAAQEIRSGDITRDEGISLVRRFDGEYPERFEREVFDYLSVDGFAPMTRERLFMLADKFKSPHLWDGDRLRHRVWHSM